MNSFLTSLRPTLALAALLLATLNLGAQNSAAPKVDAEGFTILFPKNGVPEGWVVGAWNDVKNPPAEPTKWTVENGSPRPTARELVALSEKEYSDFTLEFEFKLGERGNSGCARSASPNSR